MSTEAPDRTLNGWRDPALVRRRGHSLRHQVWSWGTILLLAGLEAGVMAPLMQIVLNMGGLEALVASGAIAVASAIAMHFGGRMQAGVGGDRAGDSRALVVALIGGWLLIGVALAALRVVGMSTSTNVGEIGQQAASGPGPKDFLAASLFFVLYLVSGVIAFTQGGDRNDAHEAQVLAEQAYQHVRSQLEFWEGQLTRVTREMERRQADVARVATLAQVERDLSEHLRDASLGRVRTELGRAKADPALMGVASTRHPDHPAFVADAPTPADADAEGGEPR